MFAHAQQHDLEVEETALRRRVGRVDYWLGAHHATAGSKERVGGSGAHEKWRRTE